MLLSLYVEASRSIKRLHVCIFYMKLFTVYADDVISVSVCVILDSFLSLTHLNEIK
jgi:hypothetical protein